MSAPAKYVCSCAQCVAIRAIRADKNMAAAHAAAQRVHHGESNRRYQSAYNKRNRDKVMSYSREYRAKNLDRLRAADRERKRVKRVAAKQALADAARFARNEAARQRARENLL